jgi:hypothetical protein
MLVVAALHPLAVLVLPLAHVFPSCCRESLRIRTYICTASPDKNRRNLGQKRPFLWKTDYDPDFDNNKKISFYGKSSFHGRRIVFTTKPCCIKPFILTNRKLLYQNEQPLSKNKTLFL